MPSPRSIPLPTPRQVEEHSKKMSTLYPGARIKVIGTKGIEYEYPDNPSLSDKWKDKPFSCDAP
jgi:hypothetical protein